MAGLISHPLGVGRCDTATVCGPAGVILSARTSEGGADNLRSVNSGAVDSGFAEGDLIAAAVAGQGAFRRPASHLRVIAALFPEEAHLVVAAKSKIQSVADLRGKRVLMGTPNSGGLARSRAILAAYRVHAREIVSDDMPPALMRDGKIDAYFAVAGVPLDSVKDLIAHHVARLVPIDGEGRDRLIQMLPQLSPAVIAANAYPGQPAVETVATRAWWVTRDSEPDALIYGLMRALFNPANHAGLAASHPSARGIGWTARRSIRPRRFIRARPGFIAKKASCRLKASQWAGRLRFPSRRPRAIPASPAAPDPVHIGAHWRGHIHAIGFKARHHRRIHAVGHGQCAEQEVALVARKRVLPGVQNAGDLCLRVFAQFRQWLFAGEIHGQLVAHIGKAGMHLRRIAARHRACRRIGGPQPGFGMTLGEGLADRQTVPHGQRCRLSLRS